MDNIENPRPLFFCELCKFKTHNRKDYKRHMLTKKHNDRVNDNISPQKTPISKIYECECKKVFKYASNLSRHKKNCNYEVEVGCLDDQAPGCAGVPQEVNYKELILTLLNQNKELQDLLISQQEETNKKFENLILHIKPTNTTVNNTNCNNNNKTFNIMMFLNDKCKDAMTIQEFAERLVVTIEDLEKKKFDCLSNTILKNLKSLSITERPVHCGNIKRKEWYLNHKDKGWELDNGEKLIQNAEFGINKKFQNEFIKHYPNYSTNENIKDKYMRLINRTFTDLPENEKSRLLNILSNDLLLEE
jgi:hypothetical protein